jgi:hypothetical protein
VIIEFEGGQIHAAEGEQAGAEKRGFLGQTVGSAKIIKPEPDEDDMDEIIKLVSGIKGQDEIKEGCRVEDGVLRISQKRLAVAVGVSPKGEVPLLEQRGGQLAGGDFDDGRVPFEKDPAGEEKFPKCEQKQQKEKEKEQEVFFLVRRRGSSIRKHWPNFYQKSAFFSTFDFSPVLSLYWERETCPRIHWGRRPGASGRNESLLWPCS